MKLFFTKLSLLLFSISVSLEAQILNGDFEEWAGGEPLHWYTSNNPETSPGAVNVSQTTVAYTGNFAVRGEVITANDINGGTFNLNPFLSTGPTPEGFPISHRPNTLGGYYIYKPIGSGGGLSIITYLTKSVAGERRLVGSGGITIFNTILLDTTYKDFTVPISYSLSDTPDTIYISISAFSNDPGSEFYVDNIHLSLMEIVSPAENEAVIAGEKDTIQWYAAAENINIMYSTDDGNNFTAIQNNYPADSGRYIWDVPDDLLSAKAIIRIEDSGDNSQFDEQPVYIKPWQLTRLDANDDFELFEPGKHGWSFGNKPENVWPFDWWSQFIYYGGVDPNTQSEYPVRWPFFKAIVSDFPDWPAFVDAFGDDECFTTNPPRSDSYKGKAITLWAGLLDPWGGSCYGFAVTSLLYFYYKDVFLLQNSGIGDFQNLFSAQVNNGARKAINKYFVHQFGNPYRSYDNSRLNTVDARQTLQELKEMFSEKDKSGKSMGFYNNNGSGGHEVTPYRMERVENTSTFNVRVYDSNNPAATNVGIQIDSAANTWTELTGLGWGSGTTGCTIGPNIAEHLFNISLPKILTNNTPSPKSENAADGPILNIYNPSKAEIKISNNAGSIGFADSMVYSDLPDAVPLIPKTGSNHPPIGYTIPQGDYLFELNNFSDSSSYVIIMGDSTIYNYRRDDASSNENDLLSFADGLRIENPDQTIKNINLEVIIEEDGNEKVFTAENLQLSNNDSVHIKEKDRKELLLKNYGVEKNYDLYIRNISATGTNIFNHKEITLSDNSTHQVIPDWENLQSGEVKILIDNANDGTVDDSLFVDNQPTDVKEFYSSDIPDDFNLYQNYPNPFNPATKIAFDIPEQELVVLKIYNVLGEEITTLINEVKEAGRYTRIFDASDLPSGVYIYKLTAGEFTSSKKMLFMK